MKIFWEKYQRVLTNKYFIVSFLMFLWLMLIDQNNLVQRFQTNLELQELKKEKLYYTKKIREVQQNSKDLLKNKESLEKFAREKYLMKKPDEELFVFVEE